MGGLVQFLRWLAVVPAAIVVYFLMNWLVLLTWQQVGGDSIFGLIPIFYVVEFARAAFAPFAAVMAGAYVAGKGKVVAAAVVAVLFIVLSTLVAFGLVLAGSRDLYTEMPIWFTWILLIVMVISACVGVYQVYQEFVEEMRRTERTQVANELRPFYKTATENEREDEDAEYVGESPG